VTEAIEGDLPAGEPDADASDEPEPSKAKNASRNAIEWVAIVLGALVVALVVKTFLIQAFYIPSLSMYSTLDEGDRVLVNKLSYRLHDINRGDLVVFERPDNVPDNGIEDLIKRVVGLEGEVIEGRDGTVYIDGEALEEGYLDEGTITTDFGPVTVPDDHIYVLGDNRENSEDSRSPMGPVDQDLVVGRAFVRVWPLTHFDLL
jgi:signal peptidase I